MGNKVFAPINTGPKLKSGVKVSKIVKQFIPKQTTQRLVTAKKPVQKKVVEKNENSIKPASAVERSTNISFTNYVKNPKPVTYSKIREKDCSYKKKANETSSDAKIISEILYQIKGEKSPEIGFGYILSIQGLEQRDRDFISAVKNKKFPNFTELHVRNMAKFNQKETQDLNEFFKKSMPDTLGNLLLNYKSKHVDISLYIESLKIALRCVANKLSLSHFTIDDKAMTSVLESGKDAKRIIFASCDLTLTKEFSLNPNYNYKIKELHFLDTCKKLRRKEIDYDKFTLIVEALSKTNLVSTLEMCTIQCVEFNQKLIENLFKVCNFSMVKVCNDIEESKQYTAFQKRIEERKAQNKDE